MRALARLVSWTREAARSFVPGRHNAADDAAEELRFHIEAHAQDLIAQGIAPAEAHRRAAAAAGRPETQHERRREALGLRLWDETWADIRYGLRGLRRNPGFAAIAICSLALAIGTATAMFSLVYATILDAFPYPDADRIVMLTMRVPGDTGAYDEQPPLFPAERAALLKAGPFSDVMGTSMMSAAVATDAARNYVNILVMTPTAGRLLAAHALLGRPLEVSDGNVSAPRVAVLGYAYWKSEYGGDPDVVGKPAKFGANYTVVGVMPRWFTFEGSPDVYMPLPPDMQGSGMFVTAKLKPGISKAQALAAITPLLHQFVKQHPAFYPAGARFDLVTLREDYTSTSKFVRSLPMLFVAVGLLLLIGCANCCVLLLARGSARRHEFALRAAVGATPARMVRQLLVEGVCIAFTGAAIGIALAYALARLPLWLAPFMFPAGSQITLSLPMLGFSVAAALAAGILSGLLPALRASRPHVSTLLQASNRRAVSGRGHGVLRVLIGMQIALTLVLLTLAGATATGFVNILRLRLGFQPAHILMAQVDSDDQFPWAKRMGIVQSAQASLAAVPGVEQAAFNSELPPRSGDMQPVELPGRSVLNGEKVRTNYVSANYFATLRIPLLAGRVWSPSQQQQGLPLAIANQAFARRVAPGLGVLGQVVRLPELAAAESKRAKMMSPAAQMGRVQIVGIVADAMNMGLEHATAPELYLNAGISPWRAGWFLIRTRSATAPYRRPVQKALLPFMRESYCVLANGSLREDIESTPYWQQQRLISVLFGIYAAIALTLALVGLYSTAQYIALQRRNELGIRLALGATRAHIRWLVLRGNLVVIAYAAASGILLSLLARAGVERWMAGSSQSPLVLIAAASLLVLVSLAACLAPAERACRINPNETLRAE